MNFLQWLESYNNDIIYLNKYLKNRPINLVNNWWFFSKWPKFIVTLRKVKVSPSQAEKMRENGTDKFYDLCDKIESILTDEEKSEIADIITRHDPVEAPTWATMTYPKIIPPQTWLIHFSDYAYNISKEGFKNGVDDMEKLALTNYLGDKAKSFPGYNFAFEAGTRYAKWGAIADHGRGKYGKDAVMFQAAGVHAYHSGDAEDQVIFYGPAIDPRRLVLLTRDARGDYEWCVNSKNRDEKCMYRGDFDKSVAWVMHNFQQYRRAITGN